MFVADSIDIVESAVNVSRSAWDDSAVGFSGGAQPFDSLVGFEVRSGGLKLFDVGFELLFGLLGGGDEIFGSWNEGQFV